MKSATKTLLASALVLALFLPIAAAVQWDRKPYAAWSEKEARRVLDDSPWGQTQTFTDSAPRGDAPNREIDGNRAIDVGGNRVGRARRPEVHFRVRLLSARPIRQAISRLVELRQQGQADEALAARLRAFIDDDFSDYIVVSVTCDAPKPTVRFQEARWLLDRLTTEQLREKAWLEVDGRRVPLADYQPPRDDGLGARFVFPRLVEGQPVVSEATTQARLHAELSDEYRLDRTFRVKDMTYAGRLEF